MSSKHWSLVYAVDMACDVVAHIEVRDPALANAMWGEKSVGALRYLKNILPLKYSIIVGRKMWMSKDNYMYKPDTN